MSIVFLVHVTLSLKLTPHQVGDDRKKAAFASALARDLATAAGVSVAQVRPV